MNKNIFSTNSRKIILLFVLALFSILFIVFLSISLHDYYIPKDAPCLKIGLVSLPNDIPSKSLGSFIGVFLTFTTYYLLDIIRKNDEPKPKIEISFNKDEEKELIVKSQPHYIFSPKTQENIEFGTAYYLRVKVTNKGNEIAK